MLDLEALPGLTRAERVQALDTWLAGLLADAVAGTPPPKQRRGGAPPPHRHRRVWRWSPSAASAAASCRPTATSTWSSSTTAGPEIAAIADALWYPVWDAGLRLDHSVRSVAEAVAVASTDVKAGLGLLDARLVAGDAELAARLRTATLASWRQAASRLLPAAARPAPRTAPARSGSWPSCSSPTSRRPTAGCARARCCAPSPPPSSATSRRAEVEEAYAFLLDVRDELRRRTGRPSDVLVRQEQRPVAVALGLADEDALLREVSLAGRRLAFVADETWRRVEAALVRRPRGRYRRVRREPLAEGVVRQGDEVVLARDARPAADPGLLLRAAAAAARADLLLSPYTLKVLAVHSPPMPEPWPAEVRWSFLRLLASGRSAVPVLEQLDQEGLLSRLIPEWDRVRSLPQRHPWHRFTVDRHLVEAAAAAAELTRDVDRPDLLLVAALLHDIGKGWPGDHSEVGEPIAAAIAARMGFARGRRRDASARWCATTCCCPTTATRRDIDDPATIDRVAATIGARRRRPPAAARAGPGRRRRDQRLGLVAVEGPPRGRAGRPGAGASSAAGPTADPSRCCTRPTPQVTARRSDVPGAPGAVTVGIEDVADGQQVTIGAPDRPGLLSTCAGRAGAQPARRPRGEDDGRGRLRAPACSPSARGSAGRRCRRSSPTPCGPRSRARCRWPTGSGSGRPTTARTACGRPRRGSPGTTARSAARRPASSRCAPATAPGCCTG